MGEHIDSFEEFLKKQKENEKKVNWVKRKNDWTQAIESFYDEIEKWLITFKKQNLIDIQKKTIELVEEYIGHYHTNRLDIYIGNDIINLTPKGTLIIGSYGRIDMRGPKGDYIIVQPEWNQWKFAIRTPELEMWDMTEDSFKDALQKIT